MCGGSFRRRRGDGDGGGGGGGGGGRGPRTSLASSLTFFAAISRSSLLIGRWTGLALGASATFSTSPSSALGFLASLAALAFRSARCIFSIFESCDETRAVRGEKACGAQQAALLVAAAA